MVDLGLEIWLMAEQHFVPAEAYIQSSFAKISFYFLNVNSG